MYIDFDRRRFDRQRLLHWPSLLLWVEITMACSPLRGKLLNVREATNKQLTENKEIGYIKQMLGLQQNKEYTSIKSLRCGHLMIMTDKDHDGSHIKGLLINFIHSYWPSLLRVPSFLIEFITPIVKGLETSTSKEGMEYFANLDKNRKDFIWVDQQDGDAIELAFSKKKIEERELAQAI
ncbi:hypothetical protein I3760_14G101100 [Carya illinoinensis]|nr:hypothetical protein I3760_14G101100 [Carya illinoinensis]